MLPRRALAPLRQLLGEFPAVAILGPRQVGKTTLALELAATLPPRLTSTSNRPPMLSN